MARLKSEESLRVFQNHFRPWRWMLFGFLSGVVCGIGAVAPPKALWYAGREYTSLSQWSADRQFTLQFNPRGETIRLTNRWATLLMQGDSCRAEINQVGVWLSYPILVRYQAPYIAARDLQRVIHPLVFPESLKNRRRVRLVALDAGHGGRDPGYQRAPKPEKEYTLLLAKEIRRRLVSAGLSVCLIRAQDTLPPLDERPIIANRKGADVFVSLHFNSVPGPAARDVKGVETYCLTPAGANSSNDTSDPADQEYLPGNRNDPKNVLLAYQIQKAMIRDLDAADRGVRRARWAVLRTAAMPAVLIECGYLSHPQEMRRIDSNTYRRQMAQAIVDGILAFKRLVEK